MVRQSSLPAHSSVFRGIGIDTTNLVSLHITIRMTLGVGEVKPECPAGSDDMFGEDACDASRQAGHTLTIADAGKIHSLWPSIETVIVVTTRI